MRGILAIVCLVLLFGCLGPAAPGETYTEEGVKEVSVPVADGETETPAGETQPESVEAAEEETAAGLGALSQEEISYRTHDSWDIYGTLYHAKNERPSTMIIVLHMLDRTRADYDDMVEPLHMAFPDADIFAIDMRGHGESINKRTWEEFVEADFRSMKKDVLDVFEEFETLRPSVQQYYVIGASIGSSVALTAAADDSRIKKVVMLSPGADYHGIDISEAGSTYQKRLFIAVARNDEYSYESARDLYDMSPSDSKVLRVYTGTSAHGISLFTATESEETPLLDDIIEWLGN